MRSVNRSISVSEDVADLISIDFRSICSCLLDFLAKEMSVGFLSRENVIGRKTVELTMRPTVKPRHSLFENADNVFIRVWLLWKEILVLYGLVPSLRHTIGIDHFDLSDDSSDANVFSFEKDGNLSLILRSIIAHKIDFPVEKIESLTYTDKIPRGLRDVASREATQPRMAREKLSLMKCI